MIRAELHRGLRMVVKLSAALVVLLVALAIVAVCNAAAAPPLAPRFEQAAEEYWGVGAAPCRTESIRWDSSFPARHGSDQVGGVIVGVATVGPRPHCKMWIGPLDGYTIFFDCALFAHEYGHWLGHPDIRGDEGQVTSEVIGNGPSETYDPQCAALAAEYAPEGG